MNADIKPVILCIMDGWGLREQSRFNAVALAQTPAYDRLLRDCPHSRLLASESAVGLPDGQPGNSEVGHMTIGAGRVIMQDLPRITAACQSGALAHLPCLQSFITRLKETGGKAHLVGLTSDGGVHSHSDHILALAEVLCAAGIGVWLHIITDGRDTLPRIAGDFLPAFERQLPQGCLPASLCGRYFAMDRDRRWERTAAFLNLLGGGRGTRHASSVTQAIQLGYDKGETDEFIQPTCLAGYDGMAENDALVIANFRVDRVRQIMRALYLPEKTDYSGDALGFTLPFGGSAVSLTPIADDLNPHVPFLFGPPDLSGGLGEVVAAAGMKQLRLAETEKYPHVTFFFNGGLDSPYSQEERALVASPKVATYDLQPQMSADAVCARAVQAVQARSHHLIIINFANPDMVGHTGSLEAAVTAVETVDRAVAALVAAVTDAGGAMLVTADHGNCETMWDEQAACAHTAHTTNPVPCILVSAQDRHKGAELADGSLADLAPTLLDLLGLPVSEMMDGRTLIRPRLDA